MWRYFKFQALLYSALTEPGLGVAPWPPAPQATASGKP